MLGFIVTNVPSQSICCNHKSFKSVFWVSMNIGGSRSAARTLEAAQAAVGAAAAAMQCQQGFSAHATPTSRAAKLHLRRKAQCEKQRGGTESESQAVRASALTVATEWAAGVSAPSVATPSSRSRVPSSAVDMELTPSVSPLETHIEARTQQKSARLNTRVRPEGICCSRGSHREHGTRHGVKQHRVAG